MYYVQLTEETQFPIVGPSKDEYVFLPACGSATTLFTPMVSLV